MTVLHGFTCTRARRIEELDATLHEYLHAASGARLCWLERGDENKSFCAAFRTLPFDDSGVFHILEHSVLCGSRNYPVKEPFVELMKGSLNTFLNALTYPDKTCYPVSSRNDQDFLNLMRVYLDAVFFPRIYDKPEIFRQEGWHYELHDGRLTQSGVVLNEMKGAFADPDTLLANALTRAIFPDTPYRFVSGGDPEAIPGLTYEAFTAAHRRFYHPSNSYLLLDGSIDLDACLQLLDTYLAGFTAICPDTQIRPQPPVHPATQTIEYQLPAGEPLEERMKLGRGYVIGTYADDQKIFAAQILCDILCGSNHAPLCRAVLEKGLAEDVSLACDDEMLQPLLVLQVQNFRQEDLPEIDRTIRETLTALAETGLDHAQLKASLASFEFRLRERDYGTMPRGLVFMFEILSSWLYDGDPAARLSFGAVFERLHAAIEDGYFEALLRELLLENPHTAEIRMQPSETCGAERQARSQAQLQAILEGMTPQMRADILAQQQTLAQMQQEPDSPEALQTIPHVRLSDIPREPAELPLAIERDGALLLHELPTDGIAYPVFYFAAEDLSEEELPYASLLCAILSQLPTKHMEALELQKQLRLLLGSFAVSLMPCTKYQSSQEYRLFAAVSCSALETKLPEAMRLSAEILTETDFSDKARLLELIRQLRESVQQQIVGSGASFAMIRACAALSPASACTELCGGIAYYLWLRELEQDFDARAEALINTLQTLTERLFVKARLLCSVTGTKKAAETVTGTLDAELPTGQAAGPAQKANCLPVKREGIIIPSDVSFAAVCGDLHDAEGEYCGQMRIACHVASLGHFWNEIRVQGGAYGTGLLVRETGLVSAYTYRDPDCARSLQTIGQTADYLRAQAAEGTPLDVNIIGAISDAEPLLSPRLQGAVSDTRLLKRITQTSRRQLRHEMLDTRPEDLAGCGEKIGAALEAGAVCVLGPREQLEACGNLDLQTL